MHHLASLHPPPVCHTVPPPHTHTPFAQEGASALYKGWLPSVIGVIPYVGLNFAVYETSKVWLLQQHSESAARLHGRRSPAPSVFPSPHTF